MTDETNEDLTNLRFLTVGEVATLLRLSRMTVYRLVRDGKLPAFRVGRSFKIKEESVRQYLRGAFQG